ncbi:hypothetical protein PGB90_001703 [Kerria lacca]
MSDQSYAFVEGINTNYVIPSEEENDDSVLQTEIMNLNKSPIIISVDDFKLYAEDEMSRDFTSDIKITLDSPQRCTEAFETFLSYKITVEASRFDYKESQYVIRRRYKDFLWLRNKLVETFPTRLIPPLPNKHSFLAQLDRYAKDFIIIRMIMLRRFLNRVIKHPILNYSEHLKIFLTASTTELLSHQKIDDSGLLTKVSGSIYNMTIIYTVREKCLEFEEIKTYIILLKEKLTSLEKIMSKLYKERREFSKDMNQLGLEFEKWANTEIILAPLLLSVGRAFSNIGSVHDTLLVNPLEFVILQSAQPIREYLLYAESVKEALIRRDNIQIQYESAVEEFHKRKADQLPATSDLNKKVSIWKNSTEKNNTVEFNEEIQPTLIRIAEVNYDKLQIANEDLRSDLERWSEEKKRDIKRILLELSNHYIQFYQKNNLLKPPVGSQRTKNMQDSITSETLKPGSHRLRCAESPSTIISAVAMNDSEISPATLLGQRAILLIKNRLLRRQGRLQSRSREICYGSIHVVGCFLMPRTQISPLKKFPQAPEMIDTKFILLTRSLLLSNSNRWLKYDDNQESLKETNFNYTLPTKIIVHGFKGSGQDKGALDIATAFLELENANIVLVDWHKGAAGPSYVSAAANTQLVGRQLALLLMEMIEFGMNITKIHIIGFSLGAHIAGYAGRTIQKKGMKVARITGLDPASPLFRELLATSLSPLNKNDAEFVDIIHTDGARLLTEGLGIFRPIGHVDYFPNGGFDQPGCNHVRGAVLASHLGTFLLRYVINNSVRADYVCVNYLFLSLIKPTGGSLNTSIVCNHLRAWQLFLESLKTVRTNCKFLSFSCPGGWNSFEKRHCFPSQCTNETCPEMGYLAQETKHFGPLFLVTRDSSPFCGNQMKISVTLSKETVRFRGAMQISILTKSETTHFKLYPDFREELVGGYTLHGIGAVSYDVILPDKTRSIIAYLSCHILKENLMNKRNITNFVAIDEVTIRDLHGNTVESASPPSAASTIDQLTEEDKTKKVTKLDVDIVAPFFR